MHELKDSNIKPVPQLRSCGMAKNIKNILNLIGK
jgi:hypothetical protein